jgi:hypothetical protein
MTTAVPDSRVVGDVIQPRVDTLKAVFTSELRSKFVQYGWNEASKVLLQREVTGPICDELNSFSLNDQTFLIGQDQVSLPGINVAARTAMNNIAAFQREVLDGATISSQAERTYLAKMNISEMLSMFDPYHPKMNTGVDFQTKLGILSAYKNSQIIDTVPPELWEEQFRLRTERDTEQFLIFLTNHVEAKKTGEFPLDAIVAQLLKLFRFHYHWFEFSNVLAVHKTKTSASENPLALTVMDAISKELTRKAETWPYQKMLDEEPITQLFTDEFRQKFLVSNDPTSIERLATFLARKIANRRPANVFQDKR